MQSAVETFEGKTMRFAQVAEHFDQLERTPKRNEMIAILAELFLKANSAEIAQLSYLIQGRVAPNFEKIEFGMGEALVAEAITQAMGEPREDVDAEFLHLGDYGLVAAALKGTRTVESEGSSLSSVFRELTKVAHAAGAGSVTKKTLLLADLLRQATPAEAKHHQIVPTLAT